MPYISQSQRTPINPLVDGLAEVITTEGQLNYAITRLLLWKLKENFRYSTVNSLMGTLECVKLEFYRKFAAPYEDEKERENGQVTTN